MKVDAIIDNYIKQFEQSLASLSTEQRNEIVLEIKSHLESREIEGRLGEGLAELGSAESCAQRFCEELLIESAIEEGKPSLTIRTLVVLATKRLLAAIGLFFSAFFVCVSAALLVSAIVELIMPETIGLWVENDGWAFAFGAVDDEIKAKRTDILGDWYVLVAVSISIFSFAISHWGSRFFLKQMKNRNRPLPRA